MSRHGVRKACAEAIAKLVRLAYELKACFSRSMPKSAAIYAKRVKRSRPIEQAADRDDRAKSQRIAQRPSLSRQRMPTNSKKQTDLENQWQSLGESNPSFQVENLAS